MKQKQETNEINFTVQKDKAYGDHKTMYFELLFVKILTEDDET